MFRIFEKAHFEQDARRYVIGRLVGLGECRRVRLTTSRDDFRNIVVSDPGSGLPHLRLTSPS